MAGFLTLFFFSFLLQPSDRLPPTAVVDRLGNVSCFGVLDNPRLASTSTPSQSENQSQPTIPNSSRPESLVVNLSSTSPCGLPPPPTIPSSQSSSLQPQQSAPTINPSSNQNARGNPNSAGNNNNNLVNGGVVNANRPRRTRRPSASATVVVELPEGYESRITEQGQVYFYHLASSSSSWYHPGLPKDLPPTQNIGPLPSGWEQRSTQTGKPYFVDHNSRELL